MLGNVCVLDSGVDCGNVRLNGWFGVVLCLGGWLRLK